MDQGLDQAEKRYRIALLALSGIQTRDYFTLLDWYGSAAAAFTDRVAAVRAAGIRARLARGISSPDWRFVDRVCQWAEQPECTLLFHDETAYPALLREIHDVPPLLYVQGDAGVLRCLQIAMVGSRQATLAGQRHATDIAGELVQAGLAVTSGLALGIDAAAHRGALALAGATIAVQGCGIDTIYPRRHAQLARDIVGSGALVSEFPLGTAPKAMHFPLRNRIISGLSVGTVVVEAKRRSGSLITVRHALEQGRDVFAVPGSIDNPLATGVNDLIKQGAKLVTGAQDILEELQQYGVRTAQPAAAKQPQSKPDLPEAAQRLLTLVEDRPSSLDELVAISGLTASQVSSMLSRLELAGRIEVRTGGLYVSSAV